MCFLWRTRTLGHRLVHHRELARRRVGRQDDIPRDANPPERGRILGGDYRRGRPLLALRSGSTLREGVERDAERRDR